jgi:hypothetical protein
MSNQSHSWLHYVFAYFSVLRIPIVFGIGIVLLPLTAFSWMPGNSMLGNLFVEYSGFYGFWFGLALFGAVWAVMLTAGLTLDIERDRQGKPSQNTTAWIPDPGPTLRLVTIPMPPNRPEVFALFTLLALPGFFVTCWKSSSFVATFAGLLGGEGFAYLCLDFMASLVQAASTAQPQYQVLPWKPFLLRLPWLKGFFSCLGSWSHRQLPKLFRFLPEEVFTASNKTRLVDDHFFATLSFIGVAFIYWVVFFVLKPDAWIHFFPISWLPPAGFTYALFLPLIWLLSALRVHFGRYRITLALLTAYGLVTYGLSSQDCYENVMGGPTHTYDVFETAPDPSPLLPHEGIAKALQKEEEQPPLILVAASGGGILAAGWTTKVLTELEHNYDKFPQELLLISSVSGGSVGAGHYLDAFDRLRALSGTKKEEELQHIVADAMESSLAVTAYGVAFPDFWRILVPFWVDPTFDRGRLLEMDWRQIANCRNHPVSARQFEECRNSRNSAQGKEKESPVKFSDWKKDIRDGKRPAVIFNTTVMETGERIAITPLSSLQTRWLGGPPPDRHHYANTLTEFLNRKYQGKPGPPQDQRTYDIDLWTAARLSATFSYVSPAARAAIIRDQQSPPSREMPAKDTSGRLHLIDGGYHDNYGVASALDWLTAVLDHYKTANQPLPFKRIALVEIKAQPEAESKASSEWTTAWFGPFLGLYNAWGLAQSSVNDTAINRQNALLSAMQGTLGHVDLRSFVFVPEEKGPLSWHLSKEQKGGICLAWNSPNNKATLTEFLAFVGQSPATRQTPLPCPTP